MVIFISRGAHVKFAIMAMLYTHSIGNQPLNTMVVFKCVIVYLVRDIPPFVMYCVNGKLRSSLLIESTDSIFHFKKSRSCKYNYLIISIIKNFERASTVRVRESRDFHVRGTE